MAEYVTKKKKVKGEVVETTYRIDSAFKPSEIGEICLEFIENYCVAKGEIDWLLEKVNTKSYTVERKDKNSGEKFTETVECDNYPFVNLRRDFTAKFFPAILKGKAAHTETFAERINRLYGKK